MKQLKQVNHALAVANVYADLVQKYTIKEFKIEPVLGSIRPDAIFCYLDANTPQKHPPFTFFWGVFCMNSAKVHKNCNDFRAKC